MKLMILRPELSWFETCRQFAEELQIQKDDVILTNEYLYMPYFGEMELPAQVVFQEHTGRESLLMK